jgi:methyl-accepting chemotaxis protein
MNFRKKIALLPISVAIVFLLGLAVSYYVGSQTSASLLQLRSVDKPALELLGRVDQGVEQFVLTLQSAAADGDAEKINEVKVVVDKTHQVLTSLRGIQGKQALAQELGAAFDTYQSVAIDATQAMLARKDAGDLVKRMQAAQTHLAGLIKTHTDRAQKENARLEEDAERGVRNGLWVVLLTGVVVLAVLVGASHFVVASVWRDLGQEPSELQRVTRLIAEGRLDVRAEVGANDDRSLNAAIASMSNKLHATVDTIREAASSMEIASSEIAAGNRDLSDRTEATASSLQLTASSMADLTGSVRESSTAAQQANDMASAASQAAQLGGSIVSQVVLNMDEINAASRKISEIIGVIDGIAFQTNILALNASVEAARAGEQGRGFAVVANEVRMLAHRSGQAAREIKGLIVASGEKVEGGTQLVRDAGKAMQQIVTDVERVSGIIGKLNAVSNEQGRKIDQVSEALEKLDRMTQQNAALVEQSAAAAGSMQEQAGRLAQAVSAFRTRSDRHNRPSAPEQRPRRSIAGIPPRRMSMSARPRQPEPGRTQPAVDDRPSGRLPCGHHGI